MSPPSHSAGVPLYIFSSGYEAFLVPVGPRATGKRIAGSITSSYLENCDGERAEPHYMLRYLSYVCYKQALATVLRLTIRTTPVP